MGFIIINFDFIIFFEFLISYKIVRLKERGEKKKE